MQVSPSQSLRGNALLLRNHPSLQHIGQVMLPFETNIGKSHVAAFAVAMFMLRTRI